METQSQRSTEQCFPGSNDHSGEWQAVVWSAWERLRGFSIIWKTVRVGNEIDKLQSSKPSPQIWVAWLYAHCKEIRKWILLLREEGMFAFLWADKESDLLLMLIFPHRCHSVQNRLPTPSYVYYRTRTIDLLITLLSSIFPSVLLNSLSLFLSSHYLCLNLYAVETFSKRLPTTAQWCATFPVNDSSKGDNHCFNFILVKSSPYCWNIAVLHIEFLQINKTKPIPMSTFLVIPFRSRTVQLSDCALHGGPLADIFSPVCPHSMSQHICSLRELPKGNSVGTFNKRFHENVQQW